MNELQRQSAELKAVDFSRLYRDFVEYIDRTPATMETYRKNLKLFVQYLADTGTSRPTRDTIIAYKDYLAGKGLKASTINTYLNSVRQFFCWTQDRGIYPNVYDNIHGPKVDTSVHKKDALTAGEVVEIEESMKAQAEQRTAAAAESEKDRAGRVSRATVQGKRDYAIYLLAVNNGLRTIEISRANVRDLETKGGEHWLFVWGKGRNEADQKVAVVPAVYDAIKDYLDARTDHYTGTSPLFASTGNRTRKYDREGRPVPEKDRRRMDTATISRMLKQAMRSAGLDSPRLTAHSLRHSAGTAAVQATGDTLATSHYMRHANVTTTQIYLHVNEDQQNADTARAVYEYYHPQTSDQLPPAAVETLETYLDKLTPDDLVKLSIYAAQKAGEAK